MVNLDGDSFDWPLRMKALLGLAALLALAYAMADKSKIPEATERINKWARPVSLGIVGFVLFLFFVYPLIWGDGSVP